MSREPTLEDQVDALERGVARIDLDGWTRVEVTGADAERWLNDLITADVSGLDPGVAARSLLLGPTGRIRADVHVVRIAEGFLLLQGPGQPAPIDRLLEPYVLSSEVELRASDLEPAIRPSRRDPWRTTDLDDGVVASPAALETWRIRAGLARFPDDLDGDSLPAEAGLDEAPVIDRSKGCYLGQEAVAKVRNLGHPARLVLPVEAAEPVAVGTTVGGDGQDVGTVTSVDASSGGHTAIARIRWAAREMPLITDQGVVLTRR